MLSTNTELLNESDLNVTNRTFVPKFAFQVFPLLSIHFLQTDAQLAGKTNTKVLGNFPSLIPG